MQWVKFTSTLLTFLRNFRTFGKMFTFWKPEARVQLSALQKMADAPACNLLKYTEQHYIIQHRNNCRISFKVWGKIRRRDKSRSAKEGPVGGWAGKKCYTSLCYWAWHIMNCFILISRTEHRYWLLTTLYMAGLLTYASLYIWPSYVCLENFIWEDTLRCLS